MPDFREVSSGDPLVIDSTWYNALTRQLNAPKKTKTGGAASTSLPSPTAIVTVESALEASNLYRGTASADVMTVVDPSLNVPNQITEGVNTPCVIFDWGVHSGDDDDDDDSTTPDHPLGAGNASPGIHKGFAVIEDVTLPIYHVNVARTGAGGGAAGGVWRVIITSVDISPDGKTYFAFNWPGADDTGGAGIPEEFVSFANDIFFAVSVQGHVVGEFAYVSFCGNHMDILDQDVNEGRKDEGYQMQFVEVLALPACTTKGMSLQIVDDVGRLGFDYVRAI